MLETQNQLTQLPGSFWKPISIPSGASQRRAEASAFPLPSSFLNVIWDEQTSYELALFLICTKRTCMFHKMA